MCGTHNLVWGTHTIRFDGHIHTPLGVRGTHYLMWGTLNSMWVDTRFSVGGPVVALYAKYCAHTPH